MGVRIVANLGPFRDPLTRFVMVSLAAHAVLVVALVLLPTLRASKRISEPTLIVDLVATAPAGPPAGSTQAAPPPPPAAEPEPTEPAEGVRVETREPPPVDPLPENPEPVKKPPPARPKPTGPPSDASPAPGEASAGPTGPPGEPGASITATEGGDPALAWYTSQLTGALYTTWRKPLIEGVREPFEVRVVFEVLRDGSVRSLKVESSSGIPSLDRSALRAVSDASPLPPIPRSWREPVLSVAFTFRLFPE